MKTIIDVTIDLLKSMDLQANKVTTQPGYAGVEVDLPNDTHAFFVWSKMDSNDFAFRIASFWESENVFPSFSTSNLPEAFAKTRILSN